MLPPLLKHISYPNLNFISNICNKINYFYYIYNICLIFDNKINKSNLDVYFEELGYLVKEFSMTSWEREKNWKLVVGDSSIKPKLFKGYKNLFSKAICEKKNKKKRNDVYIYETLRYPPKSIPPSAN